MQAARVPVKISCVVSALNVAQLVSFLVRCRNLSIWRVVLRQMHDNVRRWALPPQLRRVGGYRSNPIYDFRGMEVIYWRFDETTSSLLNLFGDGTISDAYLLTEAKRSNRLDGWLGASLVL